MRVVTREPIDDRPVIRPPMEQDYSIAIAAAGSNVPGPRGCTIAGGNGYILQAPWFWAAICNAGAASPVRQTLNPTDELDDQPIADWVCPKVNHG